MFKKLCCAHFTAKQGPQEVVYSARNWKISPKFREIETKLLKITIRVRRSRLLFQSSREVGLYFGPEARKYAFCLDGLGYFFSTKVKWAIFRPRSLKVSVQKVLLSPFHCKPRPSRVSLESLGLENIPKFLNIEPKLVKLTMRARRSRLLFNS